MLPGDIGPTSSDSTRLARSHTGQNFLAATLVVTSIFARSVAAAPSPATEPEGGLVEPDVAAPTDPFQQLPVQIGFIAGSYGVCLVVIAVLLLTLSRRRRQRIANGVEEAEVQRRAKENPPPKEQPLSPGPANPYYSQLPGPNASFSHLPGAKGSLPPLSPKSQRSIKNFSYPQSPLSAEAPSQAGNPYVFPSPTSQVSLPGVDFGVDQRYVQRDREMAQSQLEAMYKLVMEHEAAKEAASARADGKMGESSDSSPVSPDTASTAVAPEQPLHQMYQSQHPQRPQQQQYRPGALPEAGRSTSTLTRKERSKPAQLDLSGADHQSVKSSRASSILSAFRSPRRSKVRAVDISSPIMTPMSGTFSRQEAAEMSAIPPRQYSPPAPPPVPTDQEPYRPSLPSPRMPLTPPEPSPNTMAHQTIDGRMTYHDRQRRNDSQASNDFQMGGASATGPGGVPLSATSERSNAPLMKRTGSNISASSRRTVGLPSSPKPGSQFGPLSPTLSSHEAASGLNRANSDVGAVSPVSATSAVRQGGKLPLRAYEPQVTSPSQVSFQRTVFERNNRMGGLGSPTTPISGGAVPYSPYQPFTPMVPITPGLVTKGDRKRMKKLEPKTPTLEMVQSSDEMW